jgi:hypothetical protein
MYLSKVPEVPGPGSRPTLGFDYLLFVFSFPGNAQKRYLIMIRIPMRISTRSTFKARRIAEVPP